MVDATTLVGWPAVGSLAAGVGSLALLWFVLRYRDRPGATWFLGVLSAQALWCFAYGVGLLVFDPAVRLAFELASWVGIVWTGLTFLAFALEYTGRGGLVSGRALGWFLGAGVTASLLVVTNPVHHLLWRAFRIDPVFGVATVRYTLRTPAYLLLGVATLAVVASVVLLVDTFLNYGPLYRRETAAVTVSALPPGLALLAWAGGLGPVPHLNLAPVMFVPHVALDAYAFGRAEMFERDPTTVRAAERTAIDDLADPILVIDREGRVVRLNPVARRAFVTDGGDALDRPLDAVIGVSLDDGTDDPGPITAHVDGERRTFAVSVSPLSDPADTHVGWTVVCSDVTERERQRQQLEVLNRILRHNLRNDAGVVHGYADMLVDRLDDPQLHRMADAIERRSAALESLGEKAGTVDTLIDGEPAASLSVGSLVEGVVADARADFPAAEISLAVRADVTASLPERAFEAAVENLVENALRHHDGDGVERADGSPWASVTVERDGETLLVRVVDDGPGIPDAERAAIEAGEETDLQHGSGLGLWVVHWAVGALGGTVEYADREPRGTVATLRIPVEAPESAA